MVDIEKWRKGLTGNNFEEGTEELIPPGYALYDEVGVLLAVKRDDTPLYTRMVRLKDGRSFSTLLRV